MTDEALLEAMARAMAATSGEDPDELITYDGETSAPMWFDELPAARAALTVVREALVAPTDEQVEDLARAWFTRDWEYDEPEEWNRLDAYVRENYRTGARWLWQYVEERRG